LRFSLFRSESRAINSAFYALKFLCGKAFELKVYFRTVAAGAPICSSANHSVTHAAPQNFPRLGARVSAVLQDRHSIDQNMHHTFGQLMRIFECGSVTNFCGGVSILVEI
jgi:hypothetical protein